jgi:hypothetical protein
MVISRDVRRAQLAFEEMIAAGIAPDTIAYGALLVILNKVSRSERGSANREKFMSTGDPI